MAGTEDSLLARRRMIYIKGCRCAREAPIKDGKVGV